MKKTLCLLSLLFVAHFVKGQCCPYVGTISTHPHVLDASLFIEIVTQATTPNQAVEIGRSFTFDSQQNTFHLKACYFMGTQPGPILFMDTFTVGFLNPGTYLVAFKAFMSSSQTSCTATDSISSSVYTLVVNPYVGIVQNASPSTFHVYPNPVTDKLYLEFSSDPNDVKLEIRNTLGQVVYEEDPLKKTTEVDISSLLKGVYYLYLATKEERKTLKLVKE